MPTTYLIYKALHLIFMVIWCLGLFYLPRLFIYHLKSDNQQSQASFKMMETKLLRLMNIGAILTLLASFALLMSGAWSYFSKAPWLHMKFLVIIFMLIYHGFCIYYTKTFLQNRVSKSPKFFLIFSHIPTVLLIATIFLAVLKPNFH